MFITDDAVFNYSKIVLWFWGFYLANAKQSSEIYCGGNVVFGFFMLCLITVQLNVAKL